MPRLWVILLLFLIGMPLSGAEEPVNIALGKSYTLSPAPDYAHCTDPGDATQLTDGETTEGYFWVQQGTVGWKRGPAIIEVDLGENRAIGGVSFRTAAGTAGVAWPSAIHLLVAEEKGAWHAVGELTALSAKHGMPPTEGYAVHRYVTHDLQTHGRYVAFVAVGQRYLFCDEIQVFAGAPAWRGQELPGKPISDVGNYIEQLRVHNAVLRRIRRDIEGVRELADQHDIAQEVRDAIEQKLDAAAEALFTLPNQYPGGFRAVLPLNDTHRLCFQAQAALWKGLGRAPLTVWQNNRWDFLDHLAAPPAAPDAGGIEVHMIRKAHRSAAFNLSNAMQEDMEVFVRFEAPSDAPEPDYITVHEVAWTDTASGIPVASALPLAERTDNGWQVNVPAGMTRQVWLTFNPTKSGCALNRIVIESPEGTHTIEADLHLYDFEMPERPTLRLGGWDYVNGSGHRGVTPKNRAPLVKFLQEHYVTAPWATNGVIPKGKHDEDGHMNAPPNTSQFDEWVALWPDAAGYYIFAAVGSRFLQWEMDAPEFTRAVGDWARFWAGHAQAKGIDPADVYLLLVDEPHSPEQDATILAWAQAMGAADTGLQIWEDPTYHDMTEANLEMIRASDVLCPNRPIFLRQPEAYRDYFRARQEEGAALEFYSCSGPARLLDPYSYYRLQAWTCWKEGAQAMHFWAFGDLGGGTSAWNEYAAPGTVYTPQFLDTDGAIGSKQMAAIREGIEDFELFRRVAEGKRATVDRLVNETLEAAGDDGFRWTEPRDRSQIDVVRIRILELLEE